ncbi:VOC family protein [Fulvivirgaceae bacterium BMA10]|uniref:VOC family protein n=2 Tax=Splendidivirga corallicola TaxID=3051826 RepID=A0ABT8KV89_9BACT|nr:VOC family protein [Fulvivirgaceae bacterium BMA10]
MKVEAIKNSSEHVDLLSLKTVIRTRDFETSKKFYTEILNLAIVEEYSGENRGCIVRLGPENSNAFFEISEIPEGHYYYDPSFSHTVANDKIDIQIRTDSVDYWANRLKEKWEARGPIERPWGSHYLYLKDPDGLQIIIYQEQNK